MTDAVFACLLTCICFCCFLMAGEWQFAPFEIISQMFILLHQEYDYKNIKVLKFYPINLHVPNGAYDFEVAIVDNHITALHNIESSLHVQCSKCSTLHTMCKIICIP